MKQGTRFKLFAIFILIATLTNNTWGDITTPSLPGSVQPSQVGKALRGQEATRQSSPLTPSLESNQTDATPVLPKEADKIKFKLEGIILEGNHIYNTTVLKKLYQNDLHKEITVKTLFEIVNRITNFYRNNGYILSRANLPPQRVKNGIVRIQVIEGYIGNVAVTGNMHNAGGLVKRYGNQIKQDRPLNLSRMEKYLILGNEIPGTQVKAVLSPSKTQLGAADLTMVIDNKPITGYLSYDNYGTRYLGPKQLTGNIGFNSLIASGDATQFTVTKTQNGGKLTFWDINYNWPINDEGIRWTIGGTQVRTHPLFVLSPLEIEGLNENYYTTGNFPLIRSQSQSLTLRTGFNYLDTHVTILNTPLYTDHIRSLGLGGSYYFADRWYGANSINADLKQGLPILGYTSNTNPNTAATSRPGAQAVYTKLILITNRLQTIAGPFSFYGSLQGQWANHSLLSAEQFSIGGSQIGRGYDVAEIIGDKGAAGSIELRFDLNIDKLFIPNLQFYTFYDAGVIWNFKLIGGVPTKQSITSTGLGMRFFSNKYLSGNIMWTQPLTKPVATEQLLGAGKPSRVFFSVIASYF
jgi:hemolysin activation/secretion protein